MAFAGHRCVRPRSARAVVDWRARLAWRRRCRRDAERHTRHRTWRDRGLARRDARSGDRGVQRCPVGDTPAGAPAGDRVVMGTRTWRRDHGARTDRVDVGDALGARRRAWRSRIGVRRRGAGTGCAVVARVATPCAAERREQRLRGDNSWRRQRHSARERPLVSRYRDSATGVELGQHDRRWSRMVVGGPMDCPDAGNCAGVYGGGMHRRG